MITMVVHRINCTIDPDDFKWCKDNDISISSVLRKAIKERRNAV